MGGEGILVVEDNAINLELLKDVLVARGYTVYEATTGQKALTLARILKPHLIVLDLQLPGIDGLEVARLLKADPDTSSITLVAVTAHTVGVDEDNALRAGFTAYVTKPIDTRAFVALVADLLKVPS